MSILNTILDLVFPVNCVLCYKRGTDLCTDCLAKIPPVERPTEKWIYSIFDYRDPNIKKCIKLLKYKYKKRLTIALGEILYERIIEEMSDLSLLENFKDPIIIPIPISGQRLRERGFNQTELLAQEIIHLDTEKVFQLKLNILTKNVEKEHQARIKNKNKRLENIIGTFEVKKSEAISGHNIILIDDITTTGATLTEARKVLKKSGAKKIIAFTLAH